MIHDTPVLMKTEQILCIFRFVWPPLVTSYFTNTWITKIDLGFLVCDTNVRKWHQVKTQDKVWHCSLSKFSKYKCYWSVRLPWVDKKKNNTHHCSNSNVWKEPLTLHDWFSLGKSSVLLFCQYINFFFCLTNWFHPFMVVLLAPSQKKMKKMKLLIWH